MNFRPGQRDEPEINLIPFIDILLVILIFLMLTTTYSKFTELQVNLPVADAEQQRPNPREVVVAVGTDGRYAINKEVLEGAGVETLANALSRAADGQRGDRGGDVESAYGEGELVGGEVQVVADQEGEAGDEGDGEDREGGGGHRPAHRATGPSR